MTETNEARPHAANVQTRHDETTNVEMRMKRFACRRSRSSIIALSLAAFGRNRKLVARKRRKVAFERGRRDLCKLSHGGSHAKRPTPWSLLLLNDRPARGMQPQL